MEAPVSARALLLLELDRGPGFGLDLIARVRGRTGVAPGDGSVYPALASLERDGLIAELDGPQLAQGRPRRHYQITGPGRLAAERVRGVLRALL